jgi:hypothetical protein
VAAVTLAGRAWSSMSGSFASVSEQMAEQVDIAVRPGMLPGGLHHHGTGIFLLGESQCGVIVDSHPGAAVRDPSLPVPGVDPVIVSEQDDKGHPARGGVPSHLRQQPARQAARTLALPNA